MMSQAERKRRAREIARGGWDAAAALPIDVLDEVAFGVRQGLQELAVKDINIADQDNWEVAKQEVDAEPNRWVAHLDEPIVVELVNDSFYLRDGHHRLYTAMLRGRRKLPVDLVINDNPIRKIMEWFEDPKHVRLNPSAPDLAALRQRLMAYP